jgi:hypothetical protein
MAISIPAFHVSTKSKVKGSARVFISARKQGALSGTFSLKISVNFDPAVNDYPNGVFTLKTDLSDGTNTGFEATSIELINSFGKHTPTIFLTGRCKSENGELKGLRYWLMVANNKKINDQNTTPDIIGFAIHDRNGNRINYGTGPVVEGDIVVEPFGF